MNLVSDMGFDVIETADGPALVVPIRQHCELDDQDHGWRVGIRRTEDHCLALELSIKLVADMRVPLEVINDYRGDAPRTIAAMLAPRVMNELIDEIPPCHLPELAAKIEAALREHLRL